MTKGMLSLFHAPANAKPSTFSLITASPDLAHSVRAEGKPPEFYQMAGGQKSVTRKQQLTNA